MEKILIIEDEKNINFFISTILSSRRYETLRAFSGSEAIEMTSSCAPDLILLDLGLPDIDGMVVLRAIRERTGAPVIVVSARQSESEKVSALDAGANDYVTKPFGNDELLARIRTSMRIHKAVRDAKPPENFVNGRLCIDFEKRFVTVGGNHVHLTPVEFKIIVLLARNAGNVLTHDYMIRHLWGPFSTDSQILRVNVANIRRKIEANPADPKYIQTEIGVGYRMANAED